MHNSKNSSFKIPPIPLSRIGDISNSGFHLIDSSTALAYNPVANLVKLRYLTDLLSQGREIYVTPQIFKEISYAGPKDFRTRAREQGLTNQLTDARMSFGVACYDTKHIFRPFAKGAVSELVPTQDALCNTPLSYADRELVLSGLYAANTEFGLGRKTRVYSNDGRLVLETVRSRRNYDGFIAVDRVDEEIPPDIFEKYAP